MRCYGNCRPVAKVRIFGDQISRFLTSPEPFANNLHRTNHKMTTSHTITIPSYEEGSFQLDFSGAAGNFSQTIHYTKVGKKVTLSVPQLSPVTSEHQTSICGHGLPQQLRPSHDQYLSFFVLDGLWTVGSLQVQSGGVVYINPGLGAVANFGAGHPVGYRTQSVTYLL